MIPRYTSPEMAALWSPETKFATWLEIELLAAEAQARLGELPADVPPRLRARARVTSAARIDELEDKETRHDVVAFLRVVGETVGDDARYLHRGLGSSDVVDTALSVLMVRAADLIQAALERLHGALASLARTHRRTVMAGRTHGIQAEPVTFGLKAALWYSEVGRGLERIRRAREVIGVGKLSGEVGTFAHTPPAVEAYVCERLGLRPAPVSSQVVGRDRHAEYLAQLAVVAGTLEKIATEIRALQRTEIREVEEPFRSGQTGSSAMPHKRNPIICERVAGLARVMRGCAAAALEDIALWGERDITHSSVERMIVPDATSVLDYMARKLTGVIEDLRVYPDHMRGNMERTGGLVFSHRVLLALLEKGLARDDAYRIVQTAAMRAWDAGGNFRELMHASGALSDAELEACFDPAPALRHIDEIFARAGLSPTGELDTGDGGAVSRRAETGGRPTAVMETDLGLPRVARGKVRDIYEAGPPGGRPARLLIVATDRLSAFDCVLPTGIPDRGRVLTQLSAFWFERLRGIVPNHYVTIDPAEFPAETRPHRDMLAGRAMLVERCRRIDFECVVRGYLAGSAWKEYRETGRACGVPLPHGLALGSRLPHPIFTPATKNDRGHDENITVATMAESLGESLGRRLETVSLALYREAAAVAEQAGFILVDTKFEFGLRGDEVVWIDEAVTPDSSRFWDARNYAATGSTESYDKQVVRDYLERTGWNKQPPAPALPDEIVDAARSRYLDVYRRITGRELLPLGAEA